MNSGVFTRGILLSGALLTLMQTIGDRILLLPAWPKDWDVDFKLHAPRQTTVECSFRVGKIKKLIVSPHEREKDVVVCPVGDVLRPIPNH